MDAGNIFGAPAGAALPPLPVVAAPSVAGVSSVVEADTPCRKCSYNLRSLPIGGKCPECGSPVGAAVFGDLLKFSLPEWVRALGRGAKLVYWGCTLVVLAFFALIMVFVVALFGRAPGVPSPLMMWAFPFLGLLLVGSGIMTLIGWWLLTRPDPSGLGEDRYGTSRQIIRITLIICILNYFLDFVANSSAMPPGMHQALRGVQIAMSLAFAVGLGAQLRYLEKLAARIPDERLGKKSANIKTTFPVCYALMMGAQQSALAGPARAGVPGAVSMFFGCTGFVALLGALICFLSYMRILRALSMRLVEETKQSALIWAGNLPGNSGN